MSFSTSSWTLTTALPTFFSFLIALCYTLAILSYPPHHRLPAYLLYLVPTAYAFLHHQQLTPWFTLNDTFGRMLYIWAAYVSYAFLIIGVRPVDGDGVEVREWRGRLRWAEKVLYTRRLEAYYPHQVALGTHEKAADTECGAVRASERRETPHNLTQRQFFLHRASRAVLFSSLNWIWEACLAPFSSSSLVQSPQIPFFLQIPFFPQIPTSLHPAELVTRALMTVDTCIIDALYFSTLYHLSALIRVLLLYLDEPSEWSFSLFGSLRDCYSIRRYWSVYWHDFIRASFSAHARVVTGRVLGWQGRGVVRRAVENGMVFGASGLAHAGVRWVQTGGEGEVWAIALWYAGQMVPMVLEGLVWFLWEGSGTRTRVGECVGEKGLVRVERAVGYAWVFGWMFWSVPKYLLTRDAWEMEKLKRRYPELFDRVGDARIGT